MDRNERGYRPISDYAIVGDGHTAALIAGDGAIDWCCWPRFDSGAVFCRLLDKGKGGWFRAGPPTGEPGKREYVKDTNVLATMFQTEGGAFRTTTLMPIERRPEEDRGKDLAPSHRILTLLEGLSSMSEVEIEFRPTFDFARGGTSINIRENGAVAPVTSGEAVSLHCPGALKLDASGTARGTIQLRQGDRVWIALSYGNNDEAAPAAAANADRDLRRTIKYWQDWLAACTYEGPYSDLVHRSALALKLLIYSPTGALVAAPTTSLPEKIGGVRNWDYRYTWLRDSGLILRALESIGYYDEGLNFFGWLEDLNLHRRGRLQIMYTVEGDSELPEGPLEHLDGYRDSRPVRIGNGASTNVQLDIYGEVLDAAYLCFTKMRKKLHSEVWSMLSHLADQAAELWRKPDRSIWEFRAGPRQFVYSKLLCWAAVDRALKLANELKLDGNLERWRAARAEIRETILTRGYNREVGAFTQTFESEDLDASLLAIERLGFLPADDPRVISNTRQIKTHLMHKGLVYRYRNEDGLPSGEGAFALCTLWLAINLAAQGRTDEASGLFESITGHASDLGLLSEEIDPERGELLGNYPQGFTHLGVIRAAAQIAEAEAAHKRGGRATHAGHAPPLKA